MRTAPRWRRSSGNHCPGHCLSSTNPVRPMLYRACRDGQAGVAGAMVAAYDRHAVWQGVNMAEMRIAIAGLGTIGRDARAPARRRHARADARLRRGARRGEGARLARRGGDRGPDRRARRIPAACRPRGRVRAGEDPRRDLPADAHRRQAGDGALLRRAAAAPGTARAREAAWRPHHRADRRAARPRRGRGGRRGHDPLGEDDDAQAAERSRRRAAPREERHLGRRPERAEAGVLRHARATRRRAFRPT